ncbi:MAG: long-chain fatty acid--CoA ligase [Leptospirales bacterium]|nr:long-chain fatty acid--CoA ligase [Leptospirales bacterium]
MEEPKLLTVCQAFYNSANRLGNRIAQVFNPALYSGETGTYTWNEMKKRVEDLACGLLSLGYNKQERIGIMSVNSPYWTHADMAISNCGGVSVTIYPTLSLSEVEYIVNDSQCRYLFIGNAELLSRISSGLNKMPSLEKIIIMDMNYKSDNPKFMGLIDLIDIGKKYAVVSFGEYEARWKNVTLEDWHTILYTSGTTGQGKGVILTHWSLGSRIVGTLKYFAKYEMDITENDVTMSFLPLAHIFDRGSCQGLAIWQGATITYADSPATIVADMQKYNPSWFNCVPRLSEKIYIQLKQTMSESAVKNALFNWAIKVGERAVVYRTDESGCYNMSPSFDLASKLPLGLKIKYKIADKIIFSKIRALFGNRFRFTFSASASISPELLKLYYIFGLAFVEGYGSTESCNACVLNPLTACNPGYIGKIANGATGRIAEDGELEIGSAGLFKGYLNKPEEDKAAFTNDGWFRTGDIVVQENGYYKIIDRKKAIICLATGKNVAPAKIEGMFGTSPYIEQIFTIGDERNYITSLFVPNFMNFISIFDKEKIPYDKSKLVYSSASGIPICIEVGEEFIENQKLKDLIAKEVAQANSKLEDFETIKNYAILRKRFTEESGELTPTQKCKKRVIIQNYSDTIEGLYKG